MKKSSAKSIADSAGKKSAIAPRTLAIDIGGSGIKAVTLDPAGKPLNERIRVATPKHARPKDIVEIVRKLAKAQDGFERVSVGFPGVVKHGIIYTAPNLGKGWSGFDLALALEHKVKQPVRVANDADVQGLGCVNGRGLELVITLGTGFGSVLFVDGVPVHLELGHHPFHEGKTYEDELGQAALEKKGPKKWNKLLQEAIAELKQTFNYDKLYIGGGNSRLVKFELPPDVQIISNEDGLLGGIKLWQEAAPQTAKPTAKSAPGPVKLQAKTPVKPPSKVRARIAPAASSKPASTLATRPAPAAVAKPAAVSVDAGEKKDAAQSVGSPTSRVS
jgi:polyphosphate glucokinase